MPGSDTVLAVKFLTTTRTGGYSGYEYPPVGEQWPEVAEPHECGHNGYWLLRDRAQARNWLTKCGYCYASMALCEVALATEQTQGDKVSATTGRIVREAGLNRSAEWQRADAEWRRADAEWRRAYAEWQRADAEWRRADAEWQRAYAEWRRAYAEWQRADAADPIIDRAMAILDEWGFDNGAQ